MANEEDALAEKPKSRRKTFVLIGFAALIIIAAIAAGVWFYLEQTTATKEAEEQIISGDLSDVVSFVTLPEMLISIRSDSPRQQYLKLQVSLHLQQSKDEAVIERLIPKILDDYQAFIRNLTAEDLVGAEGWYRLKEELLIRVNRAINPLAVREVVIADLLLQ